MKLTEVVVAPFDYNHGRGLALVFWAGPWRVDLKAEFMLGDSPEQTAQTLRDLADACEVIQEKKV